MDGETVIEAKQSGMFVDLDTKKPRRLPEDLRENMRST
jgi:acyl-CoA thioesterase FadM